MHTPTYISNPLCTTSHRPFWVRGTRLTPVHPPPHHPPIFSSPRACRTSPSGDNVNDGAATNSGSPANPVQNAVRRHLSRKAPLHVTMDSYLQCVECYALYMVEPEELDNSPRVVGCSNCLHEWYATEADLLWGEDEALEALGKRDNKPRKERQLPKVQIPDSDGGVNIFVGNLSFRATIDDLHRAFAGYGEIVRCQIPSDQSGASRGYGFVEMKRRKDGLAAIDSLQGVSILGRDLALMEARQRDGGDFERRKRSEGPEERSKGRADDAETGKRGRDPATWKGALSDPLTKSHLDKNVSSIADERGARDRQREGKGMPESRGWRVPDDNETRKVVKAIAGGRDERKGGRAGGGRSKRGMGLRTARRQKETSETRRSPGSNKKG